MSKVVFLSAGHGGTDPGACGFGLLEKDVNLTILLSCKEVLEQHGLKVVCSRTKDENDPVRDEFKEANLSNADIAVSFHTNAGGGDGSETFYYPGSSEGKHLAELCEKHTKLIGQNSRGVKSGKDLMFVNSTKMTAVLCECAFCDSKDSSLINTKEKQKQFGIAYAKAILEYFGIERKVTTSTYVNTSKPYKVICGSFTDKNNAIELQEKLKKCGFNSVIVCQ